MRASALILTFLINFLTLPLYAGSRPILTKNQGKLKVVSYDYNDDSKIDLIETFSGDDLVKKEQDLNFDGIMDETTEYFKYTSDTEAIEIITKKDRQAKVYRNLKLQLYISTTTIDTDGDGKYDRTITDHTEISQKKESPCDPNLIPFLQSATNLESDIEKVMGKLNNGFVQTKFGHKIHQSCFKNWGVKNFSSILSQSMSKGLSCLSELAQNNKKNAPTATNGALNNLMGLKRLIENEQVSIICHESDYNWTGTAGHASTSKEDKIAGLQVNHPYLSLSPNNPKNKGKATEEEMDEMKKTLFHEQLHNLGIRHGEGIEFPYTCETCCLPSKDDSSEAIASSCKICSGQYDLNKNGQESYAKDAVVWGEHNYNSAQSLKAVVNYIKENPRSQSGITLFARANSGIFSPVGIEMAKILKSKLKNLTASDKENLERALEYQDVGHIATQSAKAKVIAEANIILYYEGDPEKALSFLETNKSTLKSILAQSKKTSTKENDKYTQEELLKDSKRALFDIWLQKYPKNAGEKNSSKAYDILNEVGLI